SAVAGVVGLVPQGLVLLVSMAMAVAIVRLARHHVVVQELHAVEGLARIDVLCVDKTGTLTTGRFRFEEIIPLGLDLAEARDAIGAYVASEATPTSSTRVLAEELPAPSGWDAAEHVAFSSARKWSATTFVGRGTWVLGAPETVLDTMPVSRRGAAPEIVAGLASDAKRLLLAAHTDEQLGDDGELPGGLRPAALVVLSEELRGDAAEILGFFARQHVDVKIISGDSEATVSAVARRLGIDGADRSVDLRHVEPDDLARVTDEATVFGRVLPEQKREIVGALQSAGHTVAMTGDGVNDIPALKSADTGIAMDTATPATKSVAQLVLLDGRFDRLPHVVGEGRRVVANMERVSSLFVTKTVYATIVALFIGVSGSVFPFLPRHLSLVSELTIGIPAFLLSFRAADRPTRPGYLRRVLRFAIPAGIVAATVTLVAYWLIRAEPIHAAQAEARTASTLALVSIALWILYRLMRPLDRYEGLLLGALIAAFLAIIGAGPTREFYALDWPPWFGVGLVAGVVFGSIVLLETLLRWVRPQEWAWLERLVGDLDGSLDDADAESGIAGAAVGDRIDAAATGDPS
ncbi:MAG: HAD-IC family P-type ATPase, partial [Actinomycetota bacterium]